MECLGCRQRAPVGASAIASGDVWRFGNRQILRRQLPAEDLPIAKPPHIARGDSRGTNRRALATAEALHGGRGYTFSSCSSDEVSVCVDFLLLFHFCTLATIGDSNPARAGLESPIVARVQK